VSHNKRHGFVGYAGFVGLVGLLNRLTDLTVKTGLTLLLAVSCHAASLWPDGTNTGYKNAPDYPGSLSNGSGTTIQSNHTYNFLDFNGLAVGSAASHVTNVTFHGCRFKGVAVEEALVVLFGDNITFDYCSFEPGVAAPPTPYTSSYQYGIEGNGSYNSVVGALTVTHSDFWGFGNAIDTGGSTQAKPHVFRDNWIHDAAADGGSYHTDGIGNESGAGRDSYVVMDHNTIESLGNTNGIAYQAGSYDHFTITNNLLGGFGYTVATWAPAPGTIFTGNTFSTRLPVGYGPLYPQSFWTSSGSIWKCNKWKVPAGAAWGNTAHDGWYWVPDDSGNSGSTDASFVSQTDYLGNTSCGTTSITSPQWPNTGLTHGSQLTASMVGPAVLGVTTAQLRAVDASGSRIGTWPSDPRPSWIPTTPYVYNNDPANHGGVVPAGGMLIDGFQVPAGAWVAQFNDFGNSGVIINGDNNGASPSFPGIVFRGNRWRNTTGAPGNLNFYQNSHTKAWILFNDAGGLGAADAQYNEVPFSTNDGTSDTIFFRNYISYTTTGIQPGNRSSQIIENLVEKITFFYGEAGPPGEGGAKHLNGISLNGGQSNVLVLRNKSLLQSPDDAGRTVQQTDALAFFQDAGAFPGTGTNLDGSVGYLVKDNYFGGGGYTIYAGLNPGKASSSVQHMVLSGNKVTTQWWPNGGSFGVLSAEPAWGSFGNSCTNTTWADGARAGQSVSASCGGAAPPASACDLNGDLSTNISDVQQSVNQAIGMTACTAGDINKDGNCTVVDVQRTVNAALGGQCVTQ
jgi:hypothetical protein